MKTIAEVNKSLAEKMGKCVHRHTENIPFTPGNLDDSKCLDCGLILKIGVPIDEYWPNYCSESSPRSLLNEVEAEIIKRGKQADYERAIITKGLNVETVDNLWFRLLNAPAETRARAAEEVL